MVLLIDLPPPPQLSHPWLRTVYKWSLDLRVVVPTIIAYVLAVQVANYRNKTVPLKPKGNILKPKKQWTAFDIFVVLHNLALTVFSGITFVNVFILFINNFRTRPLLEGFCDLDKTWSNSGVAMWIWIFYLSKYYELLDTFILLSKGKQSSFLQTFHHAGSIISMWLQAATRLSFGWVFVLFNSFIHTVMYTYYTLTCFGYQPSWKRLLTRMQIIQFLVGDPLAMVYFLIPECASKEDGTKVEIIPGYPVSLHNFVRLGGAITIGFVALLVPLFWDFSAKTYGTKPVGQTKPIIKAKKQA